MRKGVKSAIVAGTAHVEARDMSIYTKTGDGGETSLYGGKRVSKTDALVNACGTIDELQSFIGVVIAKIQNKDERRFLITIQDRLYRIMGELAGASKTKKISQKDVSLLELRIDEIQKNIPTLNTFILPYGTELSSWFHVLRTVTRRAERSVVGLPSAKSIIVPYINRLSDLFFMLARKYNSEEKS